MTVASTTDRSRRAWARRVVTEIGDRAEPGAAPPDPLSLVATVATTVARALPDPELALAALGPDAARVDAGADDGGSIDVVVPGSADGPLPEPPGGWADPWLPGLVHEQAVSGQQRSARGAWYTPASVVRGLVALATADGRVPATILDPTCGGGAFLLAALDRVVELGLDPGAAVARVAGTDIDPVAVQVSRWSVALWAAANGEGIDPASLAIRRADALAEGPVEGPIDDRDGPLLVVGNPPFATPLRSGRLGPAAASYRAANRDLLGPYSDLAAVHLLAALGRAQPGSTIALVLPQSVLSGRDTQALRQHCHRAAPLQALWATREAVFDAGVRACAVVLRVGAEAPPSVVLAQGPQVAPVERSDPDPDGPDRWADHAARALGAPALPPTLAGPAPSGGASAGTLGDLAETTAGFRDEYYGLVDACREWEGPAGGEPNRLVTVGSVDPLDPGWGRVACRLGGRRWLRPTVDVDALDAKVGRWVEQRLRPKVVLATQSRVLEPVLDRAGTLIPATPLIAVAADPDDLDRVAAILLAPPIVAWSWQRWFGSALSVDALKLAASQVRLLPLPLDQAAWAEAAALVGTADLVDPDERATLADRVAATMNRAYGAGDEVLEWWRARATPRRRSASADAAADPSEPASADSTTGPPGGIASSAGPDPVTDGRRPRR